MRIATLNCNGIRAAARKGFYDWLPGQGIDVLCLQETRCTDADIADPLYHPAGFQSHWLHAEKKGYSGVAIYARKAPDAVIRGYGDAEFDAEGRYLEYRYGALSVVSLYLPSGSSGPDRQEAKYRCLASFEAHMEGLVRAGREVILCGDFNIAHQPIDLKNWKGNLKNSGFLPEERAWLDKVFGPMGWLDAFRAVNADPDQYTWWSNRGQAWAKNVGWRIDYQVTTPGIGARVHSASIWTESRFSDHAPLILDYHHEF
jgi:exodeoxyribonuclease III